MSRGSAKTIAPRIRISLYGDENARCSGSNRLDLPSSSSACMLRSTIPSIFNAISSRDQRCGSFEPKRRANGGMRWRQRDRASSLGFLRRVIMPVDQLGLPCDIDAIRALARRHGLRVLGDAACAGVERFEAPI